MIDSHCHFNDQTLYKDIDKYIENAKKEGVKNFLVVGWDVKSSKLAVDIANTYKEIYAAVGIHPTDVLKIKDGDLKRIEEIAKSSSKVVAIGEIGLDYYWTKEEKDRETQKRYFIEQIKLADSLNLPVVIHSRDANQETLDILKANTPNNKGVMHCYSGGPGLIDEYLKIGFFISFGGPITFKNAESPKQAVIKCPIDKMLIETDSPYLAPHPYRGKTNEPAYVKLVLQAVADLKELDVDFVDKKTSENFAKLFHVKTK